MACRRPRPKRSMPTSSPSSRADQPAPLRSGGAALSSSPQPDPFDDARYGDDRDQQRADIDADDLARDVVERHAESEEAETSTARNTPRMKPTPPAIDTPPRMTIVTISSSQPTAILERTEASRAASSQTGG